MINPPSTSETGTFKVYTTESGGALIDQKETGLTVQTTTAATITDIAILGNPKKIGFESDYSITYTPKNAHPAGSTIEI
ncbi:MAG: hypothetical protein V2I33_16495 [Kangiellaceae bacterium]|jgi:hypothetical protein|nr:hypothetical protein [Kangiellaceae bacterium]